MCGIGREGLRDFQGARALARCVETWTVSAEQTVAGASGIGSWLAIRICLHALNGWNGNWSWKEYKICTFFNCDFCTFSLVIITATINPCPLS